MSIIFVHELGHLFAAKYYKWNVDKIYIYPLGGITKFNDLVNRSLKEELIIVMMGPLFQICYYFLLVSLGYRDLYLFNFILLIFNLLPIYPLDGGKILNILLAFFLPYKKSLTFTLLFSFFTYFLIFTIICFFYKSFFFILVCLSLILKVIEEYKKKNYYFNKFLLERYLYCYRFKKTKYVKSIKDMYKDYRHLFFSKDGYLTEREMLKKYFDS